MVESEARSPVGDLAEELATQAARAVAAGTPLLILVFYRHEQEKLDLIQTLRAALTRHGVCSRPLDPKHRPEHGIGSLYPVLSRDAANKTLSLIVEFPRRAEGLRLDPAFLEYLNLHRDKIAAERLRMVLFVPEGDAEQFITAAGDLWDFRHHTYWLERPLSARGPELWRSLEQSTANLPGPVEAREDVARYVAQVRSLVEATAETEDKAALLLDLTRWLLRRHLNDLAVATAQEGLVLSSQSRTRLAADLHHNLAFALSRTSHLAEALGHYEESLVIRREISDRAGEGVTLNNISQIYDSWGRYDEALRYLEESLAIRREIGDRAGEGTVLNNISQIHRSWGRNNDALRLLEESLAICREIGDRAGEGTVLNNISQVYDAWGRYDEALRTLEESLAICREIGDRASEGSVLNNISQIYASWGRNDDALRTLEESLTIRREIGDRAGEGVVLNNIASIYKLLGRYDEALRAMEESLAICREIGDRAGEGTVLNNISQIYSACGRCDEALRTMEESLAICREIGDLHGEGVTCWNLAKEWERRGDSAKAAEFCRRAVEIGKQTSDPDLERDQAYLETLEARLKGEAQPSSPAPG